MITIKSISVEKDYFQFLWLQYVTGVNLKKHCKPCLKGKSSIHITPKMTSAHDIKLDEKECKYYYLCGVSKGNKLDKNFHLAFKEKKDNIIEVSENGINITIENAERIKISADDIDPEEEFANEELYNRCRNWQFANKVKDTF